MRKEVSVQRTKITNDLMHYIYNYIDSDINLDTISSDFQISKFHLHRIFKQEFGFNIYETIKSIRLQKASNLLLTNKNSSVSDISASCGYSSQTSFTRAFKGRFGMSPKEWRKGGFMDYSNKLLENADCMTDKDYSDLSVDIKKLPAFEIYYIRHRGYNKGIRECWQKLKAFILTNDIKEYTNIALYHDNPAITPLQDCNYVAGIRIDDKIKPKKIDFPSFSIEGGIYAQFKAQGYKNDIFRLIQWIYLEWLPQSGYKLTAKPTYVIYEKNDYLSEDGLFVLTYCLPIQL
ncbi:AraC family transcriptional regulator [Sulfurimonas sp. HSL3-2]|uniref:AraC family transcriptional regulator n=1 Tax=Hydrocurvibacter mobilis TaxID=3131936 RepID=UPI0031F7E893